MRFPVIIHKDETSGYGVTVLDLPSCFSAGDSIEEAIMSSHDAITCHLEGLPVDGEPIPERAPLESHRASDDYEGGMWAVVDVDVSKLLSRGKTRVTPRF